MSFESFLNHTCDIYHIKKTDISPGFGLPASPVFSYPDEPDITKLNCHFNLRGALRVNQNEPYAALDGRVKLNLPWGTDVRINDKIIHLETGYEYVAEAPISIRNHHIIVMLRRTNEQERL
ncbi:MAG: YqbH/XkdH family protein [Defluviitaleaceae bacterium]|nr:YqbH/XkdH family protein [Defluviitaleaceae bacterium]